MTTIRVEQPQDFMAIKEVNDLAFGQEGESSLIENIRSTDTFIPELSLVFESDNNEVVGHILFSKITIETAEGTVQSLALAPMAVKPGSQNKGIGSALIQDGLKRCQELGHESVVVLGHSSYYPKFGFILASDKGIKAPFDVPNEAFMVIELRLGALDDVQGTVRYPEAFLSV